jgi:hemoglobin
MRVPPVVLMCALAAGCATTAEPSPPRAEASAGGASSPPASPRSLYERLGGRGAIEAVVDELLKNVANDPRIAHRFALSDLRDLRQKLVELVCQATGGPCKYSGGDMKSVHRGQRIKGADFDALVEDLVKALDTYKVPEAEKSELLSALAMMRADIVEE